MNKTIARLLMPFLASLPFADLVGGLAQTITTGNKSEGGKGVHRFPATQSVSLPRTLNSIYQDLTPNTSCKSIMFFEGNGCKVIGRERGLINLKSVIRVVGWLNSKEANTTDIQAIISVISNLPENPFNSVSDNVVKLFISSTKIIEDNIFARYTFDESIRQYLMFPYQAFCIELEISFSVNPNPKCI